jgi:hypothetical protein
MVRLAGSRPGRNRGDGPGQPEGRFQLTETTTRYDGCTVKVDGDRLKLAATLGTAPSTWPIDWATGRPAIDLCPTCRDDLAAWLTERKATSGSDKRE